MKRQDKIKELKRLEKPALAASLRETREKLRVLRFDLAAGKVKDVREIREAKKDIARLNTLLNDK
jgi:large subunit ribosomal protein L29